MTDEFDFEMFFQAPAPRPDDEFRKGLLEQSTQRLRLRSRLHKVRSIGAAIGCYACGLLTMWLLHPGTGVAPFPDKGPALGVHPDSNTSITKTQLVSEGINLEPAAASADEIDQIRLLQLAGDQYAEADNDLGAAIRCYTASLDRQDNSDLRVSVAQDHWLLAALKVARMGESR